MLKRTLPILMALAVLLTACGPQGTPTMSSADVQSTAVSSAWTMVAATQLANPTATEIPPSETPNPTPIPTDTPAPLPTLEQNFLPTATQAAGSGDCLNPINMGEAGPTVKIRIENDSSGVITSIFLKLSPINAYGQCGVISFSNIGKNGSQLTKLPKGSWYAGAWIRHKSGSTSSAVGLFELRVADFDQLRVIVKDDVILLKP